MTLICFSTRHIHTNLNTVTCIAGKSSKDINKCHQKILNGELRLRLSFLHACMVLLSIWTCGKVTTALFN